MNRTLTPLELESANALLEDIRGRLKALAAGDFSLHFAMRRKIYKELAYDERSKPAHRKALKAFKRLAQGGLCDRCKHELPQRGAILDRFNAEAGYTRENTHLLCPKCDEEVQEERKWK